MSSSKSVLKAVSQIAKTPLSFVCLVLHKDSEYFLCLGKHSFFIMDDEIKNIDAEIYYAHIERVVIDQTKAAIFQIELSDNRPNNVPRKLVIMTSDSKTLLNSIQQSWATDLLYRKQQVIKFPRVMGQIIKKSKADPFMLKKKIPPISAVAPDGYLDFVLKGYQFYLPDKFEADSKEIGLYNNTSRKNEFLFVQISEVVQLDFLSLFNERENVRFYCEDYAKQLIGDGSYWIIHSGVYLKRCNLNADRAQWLGWEVQMRTEKQDIHVIFLRRKYIPPIIDQFQDFIFCIYGKPKTKKEIEAFLANEQNMLEFYDTQDVIRIVRDCADSLQSQTIINKVYKMIVQEKSNALLMDEDTMYFYHNKLKIRPKGLIYAIEFLYSILELLKKLDPTQYSSLQLILNEKYQYEIKHEDNKSLIQQLKLKSNPLEIADKFVGSQIRSGKATDGQGAYWSYKISKYISFMVNGGLIFSQFTVQDIVAILPSLEKDVNLKEIMMKVLDYLLYLCQEGRDHQYERLNIKVQKMITNISYIFNELMMSHLLENGYIEGQLLKNDQPQLYPKFLKVILVMAQTSTLRDLLILRKRLSNIQKNLYYNYFVQNFNKSKASVARQIIDSQEKAKSSGTIDNVFKNSFKQVVSPMIELYKGENDSISILAGTALVNLASNTAENKQIIMQEGGAKICTNFVSSRNEQLLLVTMTLIFYLCTIPSNAELFVEIGLMGKIIEILHGTGVLGCQFKEEILLYTLRICKQLAAISDEVKTELDEQLDYIMNIMTVEFKIRPIVLDETQIEVTSLIAKLAIKNIQSKIKISRNYMPYMYNKLKAGQIKSLDLTERFLYLLLVLLKDNEEIQEQFRAQNIESQIIDLSKATVQKISEKALTIKEQYIDKK